MERLGPQLRAYLQTHIRPQSPDGRFWTVSVGKLTVHESQNPINGVYRELTAQVQMMPPAGEDVRQFTFYYDVVLHQVMTHKILVSVRQDWERGQLVEAEPVQVDTISLDIVDNRILPLPVNLASGSNWTGFMAMVKLGAQHIAEGTDHLLFLLVLLLPVPLLVAGRRWGVNFASWVSSIPDLENESSQATLGRATLGQATLGRATLGNFHNRDTLPIYGQLFVNPLGGKLLDYGKTGDELSAIDEIEKTTCYSGIGISNSPGCLCSFRHHSRYCL